MLQGQDATNPEDPSARQFRRREADFFGAVNVIFSIGEVVHACMCGTFEGQEFDERIVRRGEFRVGLE